MLNSLRLACVLLVLWGSAALAQELALKADHPQRYVVRPGDTLWDIAARFLEEPWRWPEIWRVNPQIRNPHLIHPGDVVVLTFEDGQPRLRLEAKAKAGPQVVHLAPRVRRTPLAVASVSIPMARIRPFFSREGILAPGELARAGAVVGSDDDRIILGPGDRIYATGLIPGQSVYRIFRPGRLFRDPEAPDEILGQAAIHVGEARLEAEGDPAMLRIIRAQREILPGDRLLPMEAGDTTPSITPHLPAQPMEGRILDVLEGVSRIGQYQVVVVDLGERDGAEPGLVLEVFQRPGVLKVAAGAPPEERVGRLMIFRTFDRLSYALVTEALRELRVADRIAAHP